jgi:hypothetical protein
MKQIVLLVFTMMTLVACSKSAELGCTARGGSDGSLGGNNLNFVACNGGAGRIYGGSSATSFEQQVKSLVSATLDPSQFGSIDGSSSSTQTCVAMEGSLNFDSSGNLETSQSSLKITIYDSYVALKSYPAYVINFSAGSSGQKDNSQKTFTAQFKDAYGEINISGSFASSPATGSITFQNYQNYKGGAGTSGTLGAFSVSSSSFIH